MTKRPTDSHDLRDTLDGWLADALSRALRSEQLDQDAREALKERVLARIRDLEPFALRRPVRLASAGQPWFASEKPSVGLPARDTPTGTLRDLLYANKFKVCGNENEWVELLRSIAAGNQLALRSLYERTYRIVFTLILSITNSFETAEELTLTVFQDVWRRASTYGIASGSVLGWIMDQARSAAINRFRAGDRRHEVATLHPVFDSESLWERLAKRIVVADGGEALLPTRRDHSEPGWEEIAPGIACKLLASDEENDRVSMLVALAPGIGYPPHSHAGLEELHLLIGELWIDDRKLCPGDYHRAAAGTSDRRVWSETGCTCVLMTSPSDVLL